MEAEVAMEVNNILGQLEDMVKTMGYNQNCKKLKKGFIFFNSANGYSSFFEKLNQPL